MEKIINLTPHPVHIVNQNGNVFITLPSDGVARLKVTTVCCHRILGIPTTRSEFGEPEGLPDPIDGTFIIVSQLIKSALPKRNDLLVPAEVIRDESGAIVGCRSLGR